MKRSQEEFEQKLQEFFHRHDPQRAILAGSIASKFVNHQDEVFEHLTKLYAEKENVHVTEDHIFDVRMGPNTAAEPF